MMISYIKELKLKMILFRKIKTFLKLIIGPLYNIPFINRPLPKDPFGKTIIGTKEKYLKLHSKAILNLNKDVIDFQQSSGFKVNEKWFNNLALHTQTCIKKSQLNFNHGRLIYSVLSKYISEINEKENNSLTILETGTARGFSAICMSKALIDQKKSGRIISLDCISHNQKMFWNSISDLDGPKTRSNLLLKWQEELSNIIFIQGWSKEIIKRLGIQRINFAFLDAQHTKNDVLLEFNYVYRRQQSGDLIVFDDVTYGQFDGVCEAVEIIKNNYPYEILYLDSDQKRGYAIATKK